jgi:hypothetical protein
MTVKVLQRVPPGAADRGHFAAVHPMLSTPFHNHELVQC